MLTADREPDDTATAIYPDVWFSSEAVDDRVASASSRSKELTRWRCAGNTTGMFHLILVAAGGAIGASLRHLVNLGSLRLVGASYPWGTMAINIAGSFAMGAFIELLARRFNASNELSSSSPPAFLAASPPSQPSRSISRCCGSAARPLPALAYAIASVVGSILALFLGLWLARSLG